ncbi:hypothetical protein SNE40_021752 [Patella caerulea]|uniref:Uncharacterized protein n=1 Tax=Patella caerulea TaxID=87958 RepID=A0AAN8G4T1_PATCE
MTTCEASDPMGTIKAVSFQEHGVDTVNSKKTFHFPRIILHDSLGNKLDTYTVLQEAIYRDKWNVKQTQEAKNSNEWRLPKAPPPAKPDLSRRGVPVSRPTRHRSFYYKDDLHIISRYKKETEAGDVDYVAKSLANLPSYLQTKFHDGKEMVGHRHYFQIAFGLFMEKRFLSETIKKDSSYIFPGFCTGCKRSGLCYGCERSALPHTHRDYQSRTGGGFAYWKHDRAESEIDGNNPKNWRLHTTSSSGEPMSRTRSAATGGSSVEVYFVDGKKRLVLGHDDGVPLDDQTIEELCTMKIWDNIIDSDCDHVLYQDESGVEILIHKNNLQQILALMPLNHSDRQKILNLLDTESQSSKRLSITLDVASRLGTMTPSSLGGMSDEKGNLMDFIDSLERRRSSSIDSKDERPSTSRKGSLYKAPKAFKLKERERKQLIAQSPFSTNRQFDIPKGSGLNIKKSTKDLTQFVNVKRRDGNWEEPKKFELQKYERENDDFIRRQNNGDNKRNGNGHQDEVEEDRDRLNRVFNRLDAPLSPDSGLDSEFMAGRLKQVIWEQTVV